MASFGWRVENTIVGTVATFSARAVAIRRSLFQVSNFLSRVECASHVTAIFTPAWNWKIPSLLLLTRQSTFRRERLRPAMYESAERASLTLDNKLPILVTALFIYATLHISISVYIGAVFGSWWRKILCFLVCLGHFRRSEHHFLKDWAHQSISAMHSFFFSFFF